MHFVHWLGRRLNTAPAGSGAGRFACAALLLLSGGCRMCCPAYDYCSPTNPHGDNSWCCDHGRRGSYFNGDGGYYGEQVVGEETSIEGAPNQAAPMEQELQDAAPPAVPRVPSATPAPNVVPPQPAPMPNGNTTSRSRNAVSMHASSRRTR
jgi:hypothetical protein